MKLGMGVDMGAAKSAGEAPVDPALEAAPSTVEKAVLAGSGHFIFNGTNQLIGTTADLFGNATNSNVVGAPARGPNGGYLMTESTANDNYLYETFSELNVGFPSPKTLIVCFRRNGTSDNAGLVIGSSATTSYLGAFENGITGPQALQAGTHRAGVFRYRRGATNGTVSVTATRDALHDAIYQSTTDVVCFGAVQCTLSQGRAYFGRFGPAASTYNMEAEILGWAVIGSVLSTDVFAAMTWLQTWAPDS